MIIIKTDYYKPIKCPKCKKVKAVLIIYGCIVSDLPYDFECGGGLLPPKMMVNNRVCRNCKHRFSDKPLKMQHK